MPRSARTRKIQANALKWSVVYENVLSSKSSCNFPGREIDFILGSLLKRPSIIAGDADSRSTAAIPARKVLTI